MNKDEEQLEVSCIREVRVPIPLERCAEVVYFYTDVLGLPPWSEDDQIPGGWGAGHRLRGLYFQYRHDPVIDPLRRCLTLVTNSLDKLGGRLEECQWPFIHQHGLGLTDQWMLLNDPVGHLIEIRQEQKLL